jgi:glycosyltransferase involved in cell wall biosynthesis
MSDARKDEAVDVVLLSSDFGSEFDAGTALLRKVASALPQGTAWVSAPKLRGSRLRRSDTRCPVHLAPTFFFGTRAFGLTLWYADLRRRCRRRPPGICLVSARGPAPRLALRLKRELAIPYVLHLDDSAFATSGAQGRLLTARAGLEELSAEAAAIVVESQVGWLNAYKLGVYPHHLFRVPPGVDLTHFRPGEVSKALAKRLALPGGPVLLSAQDGSAALDAETLLRCFEVVLAQRRNAALIVIGAGEPRRWKRRARQLRVDAGLRLVPSAAAAELADYYRLADLFVSARSPEEQPGTGADGGGAAYLRAQASGLPIVSTRTPLSEELVPDGEVGVLVESGAHAKFGRAVLELLRSRTKSSALSRRARERAEAEFDLERTGRRIAELVHVIYYRHLRGDRGGRTVHGGDARRQGRRSHR